MKLKSIVIGLIILVLVVIFILNINHFIDNRSVVEVPLIKPDTSYQDIINKRDSIKYDVDSIDNALNNTTIYEEQFNEAVVDSDSIAILDKFLYLVSKPIRAEDSRDGECGR